MLLHRTPLCSAMTIKTAVILEYIYIFREIWAKRDIRDHHTPSPRNDKAKSVRRGRRKTDGSRGTWAGWFKWQANQQQTRIKTVSTSSVFHSGSIRRSGGGRSQYSQRGERLQGGGGMREYWVLLGHRGGFAYLAGGLGESSAAACRMACSSCSLSGAVAWYHDTQRKQTVI